MSEGFTSFTLDQLSEFAHLMPNNNQGYADAWHKGLLMNAAIHARDDQEEFKRVLRAKPFIINARVPEDHEKFKQALRDGLSNTPAAPTPENDNKFLEVLHKGLSELPADENKGSPAKASTGENRKMATDEELTKIYKIITEPATTQESQSTASHDKPKPSLKARFTKFLFNSRDSKPLLAMAASALVVVAGIFSLTPNRQNTQSGSLPAAKPAIAAAAPVPEPIRHSVTANPVQALNDDAYAVASHTADNILETFIAPSKTGAERMKLYQELKGFPELGSIVGATAHTGQGFTERSKLIKSARENSRIKMNLALELTQAIQNLSSSDQKVIESEFASAPNTALASRAQLTQKQTPSAAAIDIRPLGTRPLPPTVIYSQPDAGASQPEPVTPNLIKFFTQPMRGFGRAVTAAPINISNYAGAIKTAASQPAQSEPVARKSVYSHAKLNLGWKLGQHKRSYNRFSFVA